MDEKAGKSLRSSLGSEAVFRGLAESGFEFLRRAINEVSSDPRFAVVHFATAIELLLKARLLREHWALIVRNSGDADRETFVRGEAKTVSADEALRRLEKIGGLVIPADAAAEFRKISAHRNRVIHFFHGPSADGSSDEERDKVLREQHRGWFYLNALLKQWSEHFGEFEVEISGIRSLMKQHAEYLTVVFESLRAEIEENAKKGAIYDVCDGCGHPAASRTTLSSNVAELNCAVCEISDSVVWFDCENEDCDGVIEIRGNHPGQRSCPGCRTYYANDQLAAALDTDLSDPLNYVPRNCGLCVTPDSVVQNDMIYVCTECLTVDDTIYRCQWCNEYQLGGGDLEFSYLGGCEFCDGKAGWERD
jgi:hypothetical protein